MAHCTSPEAEKILDKRFKVLDKGFVRLVDYLGNDQRIVQAARVNEISGRYSVMTEELYVPAAEHVALQSEDNKQGRSSKKTSARLQKEVRGLLEKGQKEAYRQYGILLKSNIARELARITLPLSLYTEWYWQIDLHNLFRFLKLRLDEHAQLEIRKYAEVLHEVGQKVCPTAFEAFDEHILNSTTFSKSEMTALRNMLASKEPGLEGKPYERFLKKLKSNQSYRK